MKRQFPLFQSHLDLAHSYWKKIVTVGDTVIDATCGNGHDTLVLATMALSHEKGKLYGLDIQDKAIRITKELLTKHLDPSQLKRASLLQKSHAAFPEEIPNASVQLIVYNLGYLPGSDKLCTTITASTMKSLGQALSLIVPGGAICVTCYPGHEEGAIEEKAIADWAKLLGPEEWSTCRHEWPNRIKAPVLYLIQRNASALPE